MRGQRPIPSLPTSRPFAEPAPRSHARMRAMDDPGAALLAAARAGDTAAAAAALDAGANPRLVPALVEAAARGPITLVELLIRRGAPEWLADEHGRSPLQAAREAGQDAIAELLDRPMIRDPAFRAAMAALQRGDADELARRLDADPNLLHVRAREPDCYGDDYFRDPKLLWFAAFNPIPAAPVPGNLVDVTQVMLDRGPDQADLDYTLELVMTGCKARERGLQVPLMDALLHAGADASDDAIHATLRERELDAVEALRERGHPLTAPIAAALGRTEDLAALLNPDTAQDALHFAALNRHTDAAGRRRPERLPRPRHRAPRGGHPRRRRHGRAPPRPRRAHRPARPDVGRHAARLGQARPRRARRGAAQPACADARSGRILTSARVQAQEPPHRA
jgi:hypothetical protein